MAARFVQRGAGGTIVADFAAPQPHYAVEEIDATDAEFVAYQNQPPHPAPPSPREWLERLAPLTQQGISQAALANPSILLWLLKASGSSTIDVALAETVAGVGALVTAGVLTTADQTLLLTP